MLGRNRKRMFFLGKALYKTKSLQRKMSMRQTIIKSQIEAMIETAMVMPANEFVREVAISTILQKFMQRVATIGPSYIRIVS